MNKSILSLCALLGFTGSVAAHAADLPADELAGIWTLTLNTPRGVQNPILTIVRDGDAYTGTYEGRIGKLAIPAISCDGDRFAFPLTADMPMGRMQLEYSGTVSGDTMTGVVGNPQGEVPFTGVRNSQPPPESDQ